MDREHPLIFIHEMLKLMVSKKASDLFISVGCAPALKIDGKVIPISSQTLTAAHTQRFARALMDDRQAAAFEATKESNFAFAATNIGRFRVSAFLDQNGPGFVMRTITTQIPTYDELGLPGVLRDVAMTARGLVLIIGGTG